MVSTEHQACLMLVFLLANSIMVSTRPASMLNYFFNRNPDAYEKFSNDEDFPALIIDENGDYPSIQDQYPGFPEGEGSVCDKIDEVSNKSENHDDMPIAYDDSENPFIKTVDTNTVYGETSGPKSVKTIGQLEQEMLEYFATLFKNTPPQPLDDLTSRTTSKSAVTLEDDGDVTNKVPEDSPLSSIPTTINIQEVDHKQASLDNVSNQTLLNSSHAFEVVGDETSTVTKEPEGLLSSPSTTTIRATQETKEKEPAPMDKQPNTSLFTDPFEDSNSGILEGDQNYLDWGKPTPKTDSTTKNVEIISARQTNASSGTTKANRTVISLIETESSSVGSVTSDGFKLDTQKSNSNSYRSRNVSSETEKQTVETAPYNSSQNIASTLFQDHVIRQKNSNQSNENSSEIGTVKDLEGVHKSPEKPYQNLVPSFVSSWVLDAKKVRKEASVSAKPYLIGIGGKIPDTDKTAFRIPASKNMEAQSQIFSSMISSVLKAMINNSARSRISHGRQRRDNTPRSSKYSYTILPSLSKDDDPIMRARKKFIVLPARLIFKKSQKGFENVQESGAQMSRRDFEQKRIERLNRLLAGSSKHRESYREDFEQIM